MLRSAGLALFTQAALHGQLARVEWAEEKTRLLRVLQFGLLGFAGLLCVMLAADPATAAGGNYPRSRTMRLLSRRPGLVATLLAQGVALLIGGRQVQSMTAVMTTAQVVGALSNRRSRESPNARADA